MTVGRSDTELPDVPSASLSGFSVAARQTTGARDVHIYALAGALALRQDEFAFKAVQPCSLSHTSQCCG